LDGAVAEKSVGKVSSLPPEKSVQLVCDQFKSHVTKATMRRVKDLNMQLAVIPEGLTCQLQPLDLSINKSFNVFVHEE
jgi:hypothetical protein